MAGGSPEQFAAFIQREIAKWAKVVKAVRTPGGMTGGVAPPTALPGAIFPLNTGLRFSMKARRPST